MQKIKDLDNVSLNIPKGKLPIIAQIVPKNSARLVTQKPDVDKHLCNHCNACVKFCPVGAIDESTLEINEHKCLRCFSCVKRCVKKARKIIYKSNFIVSRVLKMKNKIAKEPKLYL